MARQAALRTVKSDVLVTENNSIEYNFTLEEAFPKVDPAIKPLGSCALFQIRHAKKMTKGGIILTGDGRSTEYYNTQIAKCVAVGPLCFKIARNIEDPISRELMERLFDYAEGPWFKPGDFVRVPKYGGDRFTAPYKYQGFDNGEKAMIEDEILFAIFKAKDVLGVVTGDPLKIKSFYE